MTKKILEQRVKEVKKLSDRAVRVHRAACENGKVPKALVKQLGHVMSEAQSLYWDPQVGFRRCEVARKFKLSHYRCATSTRGSVGPAGRHYGPADRKSAAQSPQKSNPEK